MFGTTLPRWISRAAFVLGMIALAGCARFEPRPVLPEVTAAALEQRTLAEPGLKSFLEKNLGCPLTQWPPAVWDEETLTLVAFYFHPSLDLARAQWSVAQGGVETAGARPNPVLLAEPGYTANPGGISPWIPFFSLDVPIETAGKRGYRRAQAGHLSEAARLNIITTAWQVRGNLRSSLLDYAAARQRANLLQQQYRLQEQIVALLEQRLQAGAISRNELTLPRLALTKAGVDYADAVRLAAEARVRVAEALGLSVQALAGIEFDLPLIVPADAGREFTTAEARQQALLGRSDVQSALAEYAASQSLLQLEIARQYPDVRLAPGYQYDQGENKWTLGISVELPVLNQNQGPIAEAKAKREEAAARFIALQARIIAQIDSALASRAAALDQLRRQGQYAQLAREQSAAAESLFKAGAADKLELTSAQVEASAADVALLDARIKARQAVVQLEEAVQRPLRAWPALEKGRGGDAGEGARARSKEQGARKTAGKDAGASSKKDAGRDAGAPGNKDAGVPGVQKQEP